LRLTATLKAIGFINKEEITDWKPMGCKEKHLNGGQEDVWNGDKYR